MKKEKNYDNIIISRLKTRGSKIRNFHLLIISLLITVVVITRFCGFVQPHTLTFDEALYVRLGLQLKENPANYTTQSTYKYYLERGRVLPDYLNRPLFKHPPLFPYMISLAYYLQKPSFFTAIWVSILAGALLILVTYFIAKKIFNSQVALISAFLLAIDPIHWLCSEKIWIETTFTLFFYLAILFFILAIEKDGLKFYLLCGIFTGLAILSKYPGVLIIFIVFSYLSLYQPDTLLRFKPYLLLLIPVLMFIPWMVWNYSIYGSSFLSEMLIAHYGKYRLFFEKVLNVQTLLILGIFLLAIYGLLLFLRIKIEKSLFLFNYLVFALVIGGGAYLLVAPEFRKSLVHMFSLSYLPQCGWRMGMFGKEPWYFYFMRLLELSPFYLFSFIGLLFFLKQTDKARLLSIVIIWVMLAFIMLRNFQSRYILAAVPALLIFSGYTITKIWDGFKKIKSRKVVFSAQAFLFFIIIFFLIKTLIIDIKLAVPNWPCYF